jgi:hypothetical protein
MVLVCKQSRILNKKCTIYTILKTLQCVYFDFRLPPRSDRRFLSPRGAKVLSGFARYIQVHIDFKTCVFLDVIQCKLESSYNVSKDYNALMSVNERRRIVLSPPIVSDTKIIAFTMLILEKEGNDNTEDVSNYLAADTL